jgi:ABC-type Fe3+-siderophore transport system permease subunit
MTSDRITPELKQRNPITYEAHRRQTFWQIYFPLIVFGVLVIIAIVLALLADDLSDSKWADISLIYMISIALVTFVIVIVALVFLAYYTTQLLKATPYFFFTVQRYTYLIEIRVRRYSNSAAEPFLRMHSFFAGVGALGGRRNKSAPTANENMGTETNNKEKTQ